MRNPNLKDGRYTFSSMEERKAWLDKYFKGMVADDQNLHPGAYTCGLWIIKLGKDGMSVHLYWGGDE